MADGDHLVAFSQPGHDLDAVAVGVPQYDANPPATAVAHDEQVVLVRLEKERLLRNDEGVVAAVGDDAHRGKHPRPQDASGRHVERDLHRTARRVDARVDHADRRLKYVVRYRIDGDARLLPDPHLDHAFLGHADANLQWLEVGDDEHDLIRAHQFTLLNMPLHQYAVDGCADIGVLQSQFHLAQGHLRVLELVAGVLELLLAHHPALVENSGTLERGLHLPQTDLGLLRLQQQLLLFQVQQDLPGQDLVPLLGSEHFGESLDTRHHLDPAPCLETGVGLDIAGDLAADHGHRLDGESRLDLGARASSSPRRPALAPFFLLLPARCQ